MKMSALLIAAWAFLIFPGGCSSNGVAEGKVDVVQVAVAADEKVMPVLQVLLASIAKNSPNATVHVVTTAEAAPSCRSLAQDFGDMHHLIPRPLVRCIEWRTDDSSMRGAPSLAEAQSRMKVVSGAKSAACAGLEGCDALRAARLANVLNFARFHLAELLPDLDRVIWMDCDVIVQRPMDVLWKAFSSSSSRSLMSAFAESGRFGRFYLDEGVVQDLMASRFPELRLNMEGESFNDGVVGIDLQRWRDLGAKQVVDWLMTEHRATNPGLWKYGTQPLTMLLGSAFGWSRLEPAAYCGDLGFRLAGEKDWEQAVFLHFDGELKPWKPDGLNKELWQPYAEHVLQAHVSEPSGASVSFL